MNSFTDTLAVGLMVTIAITIMVLLCYAFLKEPVLAGLLIGLPIFVYLVGFITIKLGGG